ncbi:MAG: hypothetical protein ACREDP_23240, partial [Bradyrhizobium sp.]
MSRSNSAWLCSAMVLVAFGGGAGAAVAQTAPAADTKAEASPLKISGSFRARYETIDGQARAGFNSSDDLISLRTRIAADYDAGTLRFGAELYD